MVVYICLWLLHVLESAVLTINRTVRPDVGRSELDFTGCLTYVMIMQGDVMTSARAVYSARPTRLGRMLHRDVTIENTLGDS